MNECKLIIEDGLSDRELALVTDYWQMDGEVFVNTPTLIANKYGYKINKLPHVIKRYSHCLIYASCPGCGNSLSVKIRSQNDYQWTHKHGIEPCEACKAKSRERFDLALKQQEERIKTARLSNHLNAIKNHAWKELTDLELKVLKRIVDHDVKNANQLKQRVFNNKHELTNKEWRIIYKLGEIHLLQLEMNGSTRIEGIQFDDSLRDALKDEENHYAPGPGRMFGFVLQSNPENGLPDYQGVFTLSQDVIFKAGDVCSYLAYINADGSLSVRITAAESANRAAIGWRPTVNAGPANFICSPRDDDEEPPF